MAKRFMYVCLGILALAVAFQLGATTAISQGTGVATGIAVMEYGGGGSKLFVITDTGDCYRKETPGEWVFYGNIFGGVGTEPSTLGEIKAKFGE